MMSYAKDEEIQPFSNGHEFLMWQERNCWRKCSRYNPKASTSRHGCPIEVALALASCTDGKISAAHALRGGFLEPGEGGRLEYADGDASTWKCPEYQAAQS